jgi:hypothetical protein
VVVRLCLLLLVIGVIAAAGAPDAAVVVENQHVTALADDDALPLPTAPRCVRRLQGFVAASPLPDTTPSTPPRVEIFRPPRARG